LGARSATQDDEKDKYATEELMTRVPLEEVLAAKKEEEEQRKLKANLSGHLKSIDQWDDL